MPEGARSGPIEFPAPQRLPEGPLMAYAYTGEVLFPVTITPPAEGGTLPIGAKADWLVCAQICVPEHGEFTLDLPRGTQAASAQAPLFAATDRQIPRQGGLAARIAPDGTLAVTGRALSGATDASFFPEAPGALDDAAAQPFTPGRDAVTIALKPGTDFHKDVPLAGVLAVTSPGEAPRYYRISAAPGGAAARVPLPLARILGFAFLGGLILNLMPCVFPVLAIKAVGLAGLAGAERRRVRIEAGFYVAGVLAAFAAMAAALLALRAAGSAAGWGFQFQSPRLRSPRWPGCCSSSG